MRSHRTSSATAPPRLAAALRTWLAAVLAASALGLAAAPAPIALAQETVTTGEDVDKNNDGFRDEDPSQPWPLYVIGVVLVGASIFITYKLVRAASR
jgi:hypothetical protein